MKKNHPAGDRQSQTGQPDDPIRVPDETGNAEQQTACDAEMSVKAGQAQTDEPETESASGNGSSSELTALHDQLEAKEKEISEISDKYLRMAAEYDNFRRRSQKEKETLYLDSLTLVVKEWLPVLDNLDRALQSLEQNASNQTADVATVVGEGIEMIRKQAYEIMEKLGVEEIDCLNQSFDPNLHDAVMHVEDDTVGACTVVEVLQKGYRHKERVIRHSIVKVAN